MKIIRNKTACLFSACTGLGALVGGAAHDEVKRAADFGLHFGMAFQLTDDALDYVAQGDHWGKRVGSDVAEGKQTLPLLHTLLEAEDSDRTGLLACLNNGRDFATVHSYVRKYKGIEATLAIAEDYAEKAVNELENLGAERPREFLCAIARGVVSRHR